MSGVYDPLHHNLTFERRRGVHDVSPLVPANGGGSGGVTDAGSEQGLEMSKYSSCSMVTRMEKDQLDQLCPILLLHGEVDTTVPVESSLNFYDAVTRSIGDGSDGSDGSEGSVGSDGSREEGSEEGRRRRITLKRLENVDHAAYLFDISVADVGARENSMMNSVVEFVDDVTRER
jgi:hypothetical protein